MTEYLVWPDLFLALSSSSLALLPRLSRVAHRPVLHHHHHHHHHQRYHDHRQHHLTLFANHTRATHPLRTKQARTQHTDIGSINPSLAPLPSVPLSPPRPRSNQVDPVVRLSWLPLAVGVRLLVRLCPALLFDPWILALRPPYLIAVLNRPSPVPKCTLFVASILLLVCTELPVC